MHQSCRHRGGNDADQLQQFARLRIQPRLARHHGLAHGTRRGAALARMRRHDFAYLERIALRCLKQPLSGHPLGTRNLADGFGCQRVQRDLGVARVRQLGDRLAEGMFLAGLVAPVGDHQQHRQERNAPSKKAQEIQGRMVGPVQVFPDQQERPLPVAEHIQQGSMEGLPGGSRADEHVDLRAEHARHVL